MTSCICIGGEGEEKNFQETEGAHLLFPFGHEAVSVGGDAVDDGEDSEDKEAAEELLPCRHDDWLWPRASEAHQREATHFLPS